MNEKNIRNFSIIAHIDHGKSTLADRLLEKCNAVSAREMEDQILDNMDLERERGITIKARAVTFDYTAQDGQVYTLNLIDTPGHVDFNYEVSRSLAACEGALLIVDASQGIEAQTLANTYLAMEHDLEIRPVINKIDLPAADPKRVKEEIENILAIPAEDAPEISAKLGINIDAVLEDIVHNLPAPKGDPNAPLKALIFDSYYDAYRGVIVYMRLKDGTIRPGMEIKMMATGATFKVLECGLMRPLGLEPAKQLEAGQVGYFTASIKDVHETQIGDTVTGAENPASEPLPGYRKVRSMVYCGIYTEDGSKYPDLRDALEKLEKVKGILRKEGLLPNLEKDIAAAENALQQIARIRRQADQDSARVWVKIAAERGLYLSINLRGLALALEAPTEKLRARAEQFAYNVSSGLDSYSEIMTELGKLPKEAVEGAFDAHSAYLAGLIEKERASKDKEAEKRIEDITRQKDQWLPVTRKHYERYGKEKRFDAAAWRSDYAAEN